MSQNMFAEAAARLFADICTPEARAAAEAGIVHAPLWQALVDAGFTAMLNGEAQGGAGAAIGDVMEVLRMAGRHSVPAPLAESIIAARVLAQAGLALPEGPLSIAAGNWKITRAAGGTGGKLSGMAAEVPWGASASVVVAADSAEGLLVAVLEPALLAVEPRSNIGGEPRDTLRARGRALAAVGCARGWTCADILRHLALARAGQIVGALEQALEMSVRYVGERKQFGRPLGKFQAVQQQLAVLAGEVAASSAITDAATANVDGPDAGLMLAACRARLADAIDKVGIAHQVHGAIGFTREYPLNLVTRRLWAWRDEYGSAVHWREQLGRAFLGTPADELWPQLAAVGTPAARRA